MGGGCVTLLLYGDLGSRATCQKSRGENDDTEERRPTQGDE